VGGGAGAPTRRGRNDAEGERVGGGAGAPTRRGRNDAEGERVARGGAAGPAYAGTLSEDEEARGAASAAASALAAVMAASSGPAQTGRFKPMYPPSSGSAEARERVLGTYVSPTSASRRPARSFGPLTDFDYFDFDDTRPGEATEAASTAASGPAASSRKAASTAASASPLLSPGWARRRGGRKQGRR